MGWAIFFCRNLFSRLKAYINFISLAYVVFLCFVPLCTVFTCSADVVQEFFFSYLPPPPHRVVVAEFLFYHREADN